MKKIKYSIVIFITSIFFYTCKKDPAITTSNYPSAVQEIIINKCATAGCHNNKSYTNANGLNLSTWEAMMQGGKSGAVAIPYSYVYSSLFQFCNKDSQQGPVAIPTMPLNAQPLSKDEVLILKKWIEDGCKSASGEVPFAASMATRNKVYLSNQGCDVVSVVDATSNLVMRMIPVGKNSVLETPHCIRVSKDKKYWYVCFTNGMYLQKYDAVADTLVAETSIGQGNWNIIKLSEDSKIAFVSDLSNDAKVVKVDVQTMQVLNTYQGSNLFVFPHGMACSKNYDTMYITAQYGNMIYRFIPSQSKLDNISIEKGVFASTNSNSINPHEIIFSPDYSKYFISCQTTNDVRVMDAHTDTLMATIPVGIKPEEFSISVAKNFLLVSCSEDVNTNTNAKGSIYVIDMNTLQVVKKIQERFYQPHGICVDETLQRLYVANRNVLSTGPAPHHVSVCGGRNGYMQVIDLNTWKLLSPVSELSIDPYSCDAR